ncbi:hypothetical protein [Luteolibacter sp. AS25]|uniref:hypothetical protein n=1 Tax=Luteolibacter sp. AS25 TaxID=3135776 RepID=UPI00398A8294
MKANLLIAAGSLFLLPALTAQEVARKSGIGLEMIPQDAGAPIADISSEEEFIARRAKAAMGRPAPQRLAPRSSAFGLLEMSTAIQKGPEFILAPKGSVLFCPAELEERIVSKPQGIHMDWLEFLRANRNWITTFQVTEDQVTGKTPIAPETLEHFQKNNLLVLATLNGGLVTVIKPNQP